MANWFSDFWDSLTGQKQETERTNATNAANQASVESTNQANKEIAESTNATNREIAEQNLGFQRENLEYQKELQKQIFEREDTAYQRTKADMLAAGLNPLSMQSTNGAGEAIATSPLNNSFQAQQPAPMQAAQFQKPQTMMSPLQGILNMVQASSSIAGTIGTLANQGVQRDLIQSQADKQNLENLVYARQHDIKGAEVYNPYAWDENQIREYNHKVKAQKYDSDSNPERIATAVLEALNGRYNEIGKSAIDNVEQTVRDKVPMIDEAVKYVENSKLNQTSKQRAEEKGYVVGHGQTTSTIVPHPFEKYNTIKVYNIKGKLIDEYDVDYNGNIINSGTTTNSNGSSNKSGKF